MKDEVSSKIDLVLECLVDGEWHSLDEVRRKLRLKESKLELIMEFLHKYEWLTWDKELDRARITPNVARLWRRVTEE